ncbi:MAG: hypothetical protein J5965_01000 [Aeriscardovia sp.]|nr:hypothetical protein [Aeriscardovia sp.]
MTTENWFFGSNSPTPPATPSLAHHTPPTPSPTVSLMESESSSQSRPASSSPTSSPSSSSSSVQRVVDEDPFATSFRLDKTPWDDNPPTPTEPTTEETSSPWDTPSTTFWDTPNTAADTLNTSGEAPHASHFLSLKKHHLFTHEKSDHHIPVKQSLIFFLCGMVCGGILLSFCLPHATHHQTMMPVRLLTMVTTSPVASLPTVEQAVATVEQDTLTRTPQSLLASDLHLESVWSLAMEQDALTTNSTLHTLLTTLEHAHLSDHDRHTVQKWITQWGTRSVMPTTISLTAAHQVITHAQLLLTTHNK